MPDQESVRTDDLPSITRDLERDAGATRTGEECVECEGDLWRLQGDTICANCSIVIGSGSVPGVTDVRLNGSRSTHSNSGTPRCIGGFPHAYDWGGDEDNPESFYR